MQNNNGQLNNLTSASGSSGTKGALQQHRSIGYRGGRSQDFLPNEVVDRWSHGGPYQDIEHHQWLLNSSVPGVGNGGQLQQAVEDPPFSESAGYSSNTSDGAPRFGSLPGAPVAGVANPLSRVANAMNPPRLPVDGGAYWNLMPPQLPMNATTWTMPQPGAEEVNQDEAAEQDIVQAEVEEGLEGEDVGEEEETNYYQTCSRMMFPDAASLGAQSCYYPGVDPMQPYVGIFNPHSQMHPAMPPPFWFPYMMNLPRGRRFQSGNNSSPWRSPSTYQMPPGNVDSGNQPPAMAMRMPVRPPAPRMPGRGIGRGGPGAAIMPPPSCPASSATRQTPSHRCFAPPQLVAPFLIPTPRTAGETQSRRRRLPAHEDQTALHHKLPDLSMFDNHIPDFEEAGEAEVVAEPAVSIPPSMDEILYNEQMNLMKQMGLRSISAAAVPTPAMPGGLPCTTTMPDQGQLVRGMQEVGIGPDSSNHPMAPFAPLIGQETEEAGPAGDSGCRAGGILAGEGSAGEVLGVVNSSDGPRSLPGRGSLKDANKPTSSDSDKGVRSEPGSTRKRSWSSGSRPNKDENYEEIRKQRRMNSNRESARRSRVRRQGRLQELEILTAQLRVENAELTKKNNRITEKLEKAQTEVANLQEGMKELRKAMQSILKDGPAALPPDTAEMVLPLDVGGEAAAGSSGKHQGLDSRAAIAGEREGSGKAMDVGPSCENRVELLCGGSAVAVVDGNVQKGGVTSMASPEVEMPLSGREDRQREGQQAACAEEALAASDAAAGSEKGVMGIGRGGETSGGSGVT